jgi:hypothetical protein
MLSEQGYAQLRLTDECQAPCPMPPMVHENLRWFRGSGWNNYAASFSQTTDEYNKQALDYLYSVFPGLHTLSSFRQAYAWGMVALERLWDESAGGGA